MATFHDSSIEHARRAVAYVLFTEASVCTDENDLLAFLSDVLSEVIHRVLRKATGRMMLANRAQMNIFDLLSVLSLLRMDVHNLISFCAARMGRLRGVTKVPPVISPGRNMLRASGDDEDEELVDQAPRPAYLTDIYPPLPRAYTYRRTETKGVRESDKVLIAKAKAEQQRQVESNLYRLLLKTNALKETVNFEDDL